MFLLVSENVKDVLVSEQNGTKGQRLKYTQNAYLKCFVLYW